MTCNTCGAQVAPEDKFCGECGADLSVKIPPPPPVPVAATCAQCGAPLNEDAAFCGKCGCKLATGDTTVCPVTTPPPPPMSEVNQPTRVKSGRGHQIVAVIVLGVLIGAGVYTSYTPLLDWMDWIVVYILIGGIVGSGVGVYLRLCTVKPFRRAWICFALFLGVAFMGAVTGDFTLFRDDPFSLPDFFRFYFIPDALLGLGVSLLVTGISYIGTRGKKPRER